MWEETVNIDGGTGNDVATSVVEIPAGGGVNGGGGFLVVGTTDEPAGTGNTDCYAVELDCSGNVIWVMTYGSPGIADEARDVTLMQNGNGIPPTPGAVPPLPNDYVIAGSTNPGPPTGQDALLFRITPAGGLVWNSAYNGNGVDFLRAVIEARAASAGDVVAAGGTTSFGGAMQGLALRVDGNTGGFTAIPPHGLADYGGTTTKEFFNCVTEQTIAPNIGDLVFAGTTTLNAPVDIYAVRTAPDPCTMLAQNVITGAATTDADIAYDVIEVQNNYPGGAVLGELALTGEAANGSTNSEMFLLTLNAVGLNVAGVAKTYGDITPPGTGALADGGRSLADDGSGFILCGYSTSNFLFNNDPEQLYLVKTTGTGVSNCENPWTPGNQAVTWVGGCNITPIASPLIPAAWNRTATTQTTGASVCPRQPCIIRLPNNGNDGGHQGLSDVDPTLDLSVAGTLRSYPNPVKKGGAVTLEFASESGRTLNVKVTNGLGQTVETMTTESEGRLSRFGFRTDELPTGIYIIEVGDGLRKRTARIVVTD
jgi:hypothetical protein